MASQSKKRKCKNTKYDRGGEKGKLHYLKGFAMYHKKDRVAYNREATADLCEYKEELREDSGSNG